MEHEFNTGDFADDSETTAPAKPTPITVDDFVAKQFPNLLGGKKTGPRRRRFAPFFTRGALANLRRLSGLTIATKILAWWAFQLGYKIKSKKSGPAAITRQMRFGHPVKTEPPFKKFLTGPVVKAGGSGH